MLMLSGWRESNGVIQKPNVTPLVFMKILTFLYTGVVSISDDFVLDLLTAANEMAIEELKDHCSKHVLNRLNETNIFFFLVSKHHILIMI